MKLGQIFSKSETNKTSQRQQWLFLILGCLPVLGIILVAVCALNFVSNPSKADVYNPYSYWVTIGYGLLIGGAAYVAGGFGGFLFGLPRYLSNPDSPSKNYSRNDNLIQISDWLTKIIVGLGLTNLYKIPHLLNLFGANASILFGGKGIAGTVGAVLAESILIYFLVSGFLLGYLWTNIQYIPILIEMDVLEKNLTAEKQAKETAANAALAVHTDNFNSKDPNIFNKINQAQTTITMRSKILSFDEFSSLIDKAKQKMQNGIQSQRSLPDNLKDPNKNQWGGKSENNNRKIIPTIAPVEDSDLFRVILAVTSTNPDNPMNEGDVILFSLHNSFPDPYKIVTIKEGKAILEFISYGAFTVGVLCDDGNTELEYDLATLPSAPEKFIMS